MEQTVTTAIAQTRTSLTERQALSPECQQKVRAICQTYQSYEDFNKRNNPDTDVLFASDERKAIMDNYSTLAMLDAALGDNTASRWLVTLLANLNKFSGSKNMDDGQTENLARLIAQEYSDMKYSVMLLFFYRFKCGYFGKFWGKVDPIVITCALKDFAEECEAKRQAYLNEEYLTRNQAEENLRQKIYRYWPEFLRELCGLILDNEVKNIVNDIYIDTIFVSDKTLLLSVTQEQYKLLEKEYYDAFASMFRKYFPAMSVCYRFRPQKSEQDVVVEDSRKVRKKSQVLSETEAGCHSAHVVIDNTYNLDKDSIVNMRDAFRKRYKCWPEDYLAKHENNKQ